MENYRKHKNSKGEDCYGHITMKGWDEEYNNYYYICDVCSATVFVLYLDSKKNVKS